MLIDAKRTATDGTEASGEGTGVVDQGQGEMMTAAHVVEDATSITLTFADGRKSREPSAPRTRRRTSRS